MTTRADRNVRRIVSSIEASLHPDKYYEFDLDQNDFPVFSDKNIAFVNGLGGGFIATCAAAGGTILLFAALKGWLSKKSRKP